MYVTDFETNNVYVIDTNTNTEVTGTPIEIGSLSHGIAYNPDNQMMYVSAEDGSVKIIDTATNTVNPAFIALTPGFGNPFGIAYDPDHQRMYVTRGSDLISPSIVDIVDTATNTLDNTHGPVDVGVRPIFGIAYDPVHQTMYVPNGGSGDVSVIDTNTEMDPNTVIATVGGIDLAFGISYDPVDEEMYVTNGANPGEVNVIDTNTRSSCRGRPISST
jgi:YVTN family beta-propeller protein